MGKIDAISAETSPTCCGHSLRPHDAYGYAISDAVNTLLVMEQMKQENRRIYRSFAISARETPEMKKPWALRGSQFVEEMIRRASTTGSENLKS